jgi:hypothetical protein
MDYNTLITTSQHVSIARLEVGKVYHVDRIILDDIAMVNDPRCCVF